MPAARSKAASAGCCRRRPNRRSPCWPAASRSSPGRRRRAAAPTSKSRNTIPTANGGAGGWVGAWQLLVGRRYQPDWQGVQRADPAGEWRADRGVARHLRRRIEHLRQAVQRHVLGGAGDGGRSGSGVSGSTIAVTQFAAATDGTRLAVAWTQSFASGPTQVYLKQYSGGAWAALGSSASGNGLSAGVVCGVRADRCVSGHQRHPVRGLAAVHHEPGAVRDDLPAGAGDLRGGIYRRRLAAGRHRRRNRFRRVEQRRHLAGTEARLERHAAYSGVVGRIDRSRQHRYASLCAELERHEFRPGAGWAGKRRGHRAKQRRAGRMSWPSS